MRGDTSTLGFFRAPHPLADAEAGERRYSQQSDNKRLSVNRLGDRARKTNLGKPWRNQEMAPVSIC